MSGSEWGHTVCLFLEMVLIPEFMVSTTKRGPVLFFFGCILMQHHWQLKVTPVPFWFMGYYFSKSLYGSEVRETNNILIPSELWYYNYNKRNVRLWKNIILKNTQPTVAWVTLSRWTVTKTAVPDMARHFFFPCWCVFLLGWGYFKWGDVVHWAAAHKTRWYFILLVFTTNSHFIGFTKLLWDSNIVCVIHGTI